MDLVTLRDVQAAAVRIAGIAIRTPLLGFGEDFWLKPENLQPIGAFKIRGAANAIAALSPSAVITHSSGNHGRALAYAAARRKIPVTVVMPDTSPKVKVDAIAALGAEVVMVEPPKRLEVAEKLAAEKGATLIPPFDHREVIAGQGTIGLELLEQLPDLDVVLVPVSGGGLISGVATAVKTLRPDVRVVGIEPELAADAAESLREGRRITWEPERTYRTVADGLRTTALGVHPWEHVRRYVDEIVTVTDEQILAAMRQLAVVGRVVVEPAGAVAVAAWMHDVVPAGTTTAAVVSGGSVDPALLASVLGQVQQV
jgi:threonine dehydratase